MSKFDAIAYACKHDELWMFKETRREKRLRMMQKTNLKNKCGSCRFFRPITENGEDTCYGNCSQGRDIVPWEKVDKADALRAAAEKYINA